MEARSDFFLDRTLSCSYISVKIVGLNLIIFKSENETVIIPVCEEIILKYCHPTGP